MIRRRIAAHVTLEGKPARIIDLDAPVAAVETLDGSLRYTYSWGVVKRNDGELFIIMRR